jgi:hypothetical protein
MASYLAECSVVRMVDESAVLRVAWKELLEVELMVVHLEIK